MNLSSLADVFIPLINKFKSKNQRENDTYNLIMLSLYKDILEADKYVKNCPIHTRSTVVNDTLHLPNNNRFFPKVIRKYIQDNPSSLFNFNCNLKGREINVNYYSFVSNSNSNSNNNNIYNKYAKIMFMWLYICSKYSTKKCAETMNINIYLTPFKKTLPSSNTTVLSADNVNTAFTMSCAPDGEITIFREEEWFKVFIHETFHAYALDFGLHDSVHLRKTMESTFPIKSDFNVNEAYAETWARIINCALYSFYSMHMDTDKDKDKDEDENTFLLYVDFCLQLERVFAVYQMNKILHFMGLKYTDLYNMRENSIYLRQQLYKEDTHVFSYYILTAIFLNDYKQFIQWCSKINGLTHEIAGHVMKFNCHEQSFSQMSNYISNMYNNKELLKTMELLNKVMNKSKSKSKSKKYNDLQTTTRMAVIDISELK